MGKKKYVRIVTNKDEFNRALTWSVKDMDNKQLGEFNSRKEAGVNLRMKGFTKGRMLWSK